MAIRGFGGKRKEPSESPWELISALRLRRSEHRAFTHRITLVYRLKPSRGPLSPVVCPLCVTFKAFPRSLLSPRTMGDLLIARCFTSQTSGQVSPSDGPLLHGAGLGNPSQSQLSRHLLCEPSSHPSKLATVSLRPVHRAQAHLGGIAGWAPDCRDKARRRLFDGGL